MNFPGILIPAIVVLGLSVDVQGQCTQRDVGTMMACTMPHAFRLFHAIGTGQSCDRNRITSTVCSDYATVVACINRRYVSRTCRPYAVSELNSRLPLSCSVSDLSQVCTNAPSFLSR
ncbi:uncharacterized protein LOC112569277 [Pomacea canaliculata]|uniref:uncharacterized protein LOC112569277 n=1 Tax=Pomacea canaliculata TaxID=400727 RepID=UPI000D729DE5|nr:uncharacterized protein LOC112569277 [Pomacea canaliculata]